MALPQTEGDGTIWHRVHWSETATTFAQATDFCRFRLNSRAIRANPESNSQSIDMCDHFQALGGR